MVLIWKVIFGNFSTSKLKIKAWMNKKADNYMSPVIQNEYLKLMGLNILRTVGKNIRDDAVRFSMNVLI